jgi:hypothetical protein
MVQKQINFQKLLKELNKEIKKEVPGYNLFIKERSKLMQFIDRIIFFNKTFMKGFTTTLYPNVYIPKKAFDDHEAAFATVAHEWIHLRRFKKKTPFLMSIYYALPQALAVLSLLSILQLWLGGAWILNLLWLLFLLPLPSYSRMDEELKAYTMSMFVERCIRGRVSAKRIDSIAKNFYGPNYYWMWPMKKDIIKKLNKEARQIESGSYDSVYPFSFVKKKIDEAK